MYKLKKLISFGEIMKKILKKIEKGRLSAMEGYSKIFEWKYKKAHFLRLKIRTSEKVANIFLKLIFLFPIPIFLFKGFIWKQLEQDAYMDRGTFNRLISARDIRVDVQSKDGTIVNLRTI